MKHLPINLSYDLMIYAANNTADSRGHDEVVLDDEPCLLGVEDEPLDHLRRNQTLLRVKVRGGLVDLQKSVVK